MIIVKLIGGLGNQFFQYAAGRRLALKNNTILKLDLTNYENVDPKYRHYGLSPFNINENIATREEIDSLKKNGLAKIFEKFKPDHKQTEIKYHGYDFDTNILNLGDNIILNGYWQSEKYFKDIKDVLHKELVLKNGFGEVADSYSKKIVNTNSVSLHIRRGDYLSNKFSGIYPVLPLDYYRQALNIIKDKLKNPQIFIFTDDVEWVKNNMVIPDSVEYVSGHDSISDYEEIILMSQCRHNIIANSSFSWWGAWLNIDPEKTVIAPRRWLNVKNYNINDLVPETWTKI
jgi:hypothetical protein